MLRQIDSFPSSVVYGPNGMEHGQLLMDYPNKALDQAEAKGWIMIDMKRDWTAVFPEKSESVRKTKYAGTVQGVIQPACFVSSWWSLRRVRFSIRTLLLSFVVFAFIFWFVKPYFYPPHLTIKILETGGFQINGSDVDRADIRHRFVRFVDEIHSKHYRAKLKIVFPFDGTNGTDDETFQYVCRESNAAGFDQDELVPANNAWYRSKTRRNN